MRPRLGGWVTFTLPRPLDHREGLAAASRPLLVGDRYPRPALRYPSRSIRDWRPALLGTRRRSRSSSRLELSSRAPAGVVTGLPEGRPRRAPRRCLAMRSAPGTVSPLRERNPSVRGGPLSSGGRSAQSLQTTAGAAALSAPDHDRGLTIRATETATLTRSTGAGTTELSRDSRGRQPRERCHRARPPRIRRPWALACRRRPAPAATSEPSPSSDRSACVPSREAFPGGEQTSTARCIGRELRPRSRRASRRPADAVAFLDELDLVVASRGSGMGFFPLHHLRGLLRQAACAVLVSGGLGTRISFRRWTGSSQSTADHPLDLSEMLGSKAGPYQRRRNG